MPSGGCTAVTGGSVASHFGCKRMVSSITLSELIGTVPKDTFTSCLTACFTALVDPSRMVASARSTCFFATFSRSAICSFSTMIFDSALKRTRGAGGFSSLSLPPIATAEATCTTDLPWTTSNDSPLALCCCSSVSNSAIRRLRASVAALCLCLQPRDLDKYVRGIAINPYNASAAVVRFPLLYALSNAIHWRTQGVLQRAL